MEMTIVRVVLLARLEMKDIYGSTSKIDPEAVVWVAEFPGVRVSVGLQ
jgi:hypothetical protein